MYFGAWSKSWYLNLWCMLVSVQADSKRAKNFKNRDRDRINRPNFGGRTLARLFWRANFWPV
ncbi:hypothetical protein BpHYR1_016365 [Brachionus plicatilis]|uniref:Uncharacterized protein n=1 Tax=Brachionus plicatilis TaxID=10195 RepID=A0A3M7REE3_BRAPC|nr:hypothetical protein BpHYR1_016365 [Brachionus plicatilis]